MKIIIIGYGNIGKHIYEEFKGLIPDIYDTNIPKYSTSLATQNKHYDFAFICVPTEMKADGSCDTSIVEQAVKETNADIIVIKSTIPPTTTEKLIKLTNKNIVFSPEHYGVTQHCKKDSGFVILGGEKSLCEKVASLYSLVKNGYYKFHFTDPTTAELSKYMLNSFLALKVTFCNEFADISKKYGVSYPELRELFIADERVGHSHTFVYSDKPYYDSHCFNKDIPALISFAKDSTPLINSMHEINISKKTEKENHTKGEVKMPIAELKTTNKTKAEVINTNTKEKAEVNATEASANPTHTNKLYIGSPPTNLLQDWQQSRNAQIAENRTALSQQSRNTKFKYYCSICLIIKDENEYLEEWLNWHINQGVEHFYIYDNGSKTPIADFIQTLPQAISRKVTIIDWSGTYQNAQPDAYNDCLERFGSDSKWLGFIDTDEHVRVKTGQTLPEFLKGYEEYAGIMAMWTEYGANGQREKSSLPLRERFTSLSKGQAPLGKVFVQPMFMEGMYIHNGTAKEGFAVVDEKFNSMPNMDAGKKGGTTGLICVDHFYTKSYEEWLEKMNRGRCHLYHGRKYEEFFKYNPDMEHCREDLAMAVQEYKIDIKNVE